MKLIRAGNESWLFELGHHEKKLLLQVLGLYPRIPTAARRLTRRGGLPDQEASQKLLEEALNDHRAENQRQLERMLKQPRRLVPTTAGWHLSLSSGELEWLLQVLNDVRVGSWISLGAPEERIPPLTENNAPDLWAMEVAGLFQMRLLEAMGGDK